MEGKNTGAVMFTIFFILLCATIGSAFMAFIYPEKKITVDNPQLVKTSGVSITDSEGNEVESLELSTSKLGLKPATGEEDDEFSIPTTVTDKQGSEGLYAKFYLSSTNAWTLYVTNISIDGSTNAASEREHIKVGLKDVADSSQTLKGDKVRIASGEATNEPQEFTFYVWLHASAGDDLVGAKISFDLLFE